jgi:hypothetical protein
METTSAGSFIQGMYILLGIVVGAAMNIAVA